MGWLNVYNSCLDSYRRLWKATRLQSSRFTVHFYELKVSSVIISLVILRGFGLELSTYCHRKDEKMNIYIAIWDLERS
ncbi:hypothetical protein TNCT_158622 [Trichonephila clavata]|uniref:Uncharacterized protein n=1 Tax=Trichonephila clavata TaxID=2740835 RepID=A0A8X6KMU4_TRICU|nr:hypothetical protein TNCT_158622 [Trichonephila clavata]